MSLKFISNFFYSLFDFVS